MSQAVCSHCGESKQNPRASLDDGRAVRCPACDELVCPSCRAMSGPATCGSYADADENLKEITESETRTHRRGRLAAAERATSPYVAGDQYPLGDAA